MREASANSAIVLNGTDAPDFPARVEKQRLLEALRASALDGGAKRIAGSCSTPLKRVYKQCDGSEPSYFEMADRWLVAARETRPRESAIAPLVWLVERHLWRRPGGRVSETLVHRVVMALVSMSCGFAQRVADLQLAGGLEPRTRIEINQYLEQIDAAIAEIRDAVNCDPAPVVPIGSRRQKARPVARRRRA